MYTIENIPHTADIRIRVESSSLEGLFKGALEGMCNFLWAGELHELHQKIQQEEIKINASDVTILLIDFLSEALTLILLKKVIFRDLDVRKLNSNQLECLLSGFVVQGFDDDIKAVTYHEAEVIKNKAGNWETAIVFDI
jgi:SHS2 domain-containing protein